MERNIYDRIMELVNKYEEKVIEIRRDIHMHPELSFQEVRTQGIVIKHLKELGIEIQTNIGKTGVVGILRGENPGKVIGLRADMDALPLDEDNDLPFKSINKGIMHACGHDCHTANLLGVAMILSELKEELNGVVKFIFQPAEENGGGGREMVKEGVLKNPDVEAVLALHVGTAPLGMVALGYGAVSAYSDSFKLRVKGKKAHTSMPEQGVDSIVIAANIITALQTIISRKISPQETATFSLGQINGGTAPNIVPDMVEIAGMMRCISKEARETIITKIEKISKGVAEGMDGECEFIFKEGYPSVVNDKVLTNIFKETAEEIYSAYRNEVGLEFVNEIGHENLVNIIPKPMLGSEDFGFFTQQVPGSFIFVGSGNGAPQHNSKFIVDERVFKSTLSILSSAAIKFLNS